MKNIYVLTFTTLSLTIAGLSFMSNSSGTGDNRTGSPGSLGTCTGCHNNSNALNGTTDIVISDPATSLPITAYKPDSVYLIQILSGGNSSKFGFQFTALDNSNNAVGDYGNLPSNTQITNAGKAKIWTHTSAKTSSNKTVQWSVLWVAPAKGTGDINFYSASVIANGNSQNTGDDVATKTLTIEEDKTASKSHISDKNNEIKVIQNPIGQNILLNKSVKTAVLWNQNGQVVLKGQDTKTLESNTLLDGVYYLQVLTYDNQRKTIIINK